jgi:hypothetical protein
LLKFSGFLVSFWGIIFFIILLSSDHINTARLTSMMGREAGQAQIISIAYPAFAGYEKNTARRLPSGRQEKKRAGKKEGVGGKEFLPALFFGGFRGLCPP